MASLAQILQQLKPGATTLLPDTGGKRPAPTMMGAPQATKTAPKETWTGGGNTAWIDPSKQPRSPDTPEQRFSALWKQAGVDGAEIDRKLQEARNAAVTRKSEATRKRDELKAQRAKDEQGYAAWVQGMVQKSGEAYRQWYMQPHQKWEQPPHVFTAEEIQTQAPFGTKYPATSDEAFAKAEEEFAVLSEEVDQSVREAEHVAKTEHQAVEGKYQGAVKALQDYQGHKGAVDEATVKNEQLKADHAKTLGEWDKSRKEWGNYDAAQATYNNEAAKIQADVAAGKYRVKNAWQALQTTTDPAIRRQILAALNAGNPTPDIGVPKQAPPPNPPATPRPSKEPPPDPDYVEVPGLKLDPASAAALNLPTEQPPYPPRPAPRKDQPAPAPAPAGPTAAQATGTSGTPAPPPPPPAAGATTTGTGAAPPPPPTPPATGAGTTGTAGAAPAETPPAPPAGTPPATGAAAGTSAAAAPPATGDEKPPTPPSGTTTTGDSGEEKTPVVTQAQAGTGTAVNPQGSTQEVAGANPKTQTTSGATPQATPQGLNPLYSGGAIQQQTGGAMSGQTTGQSGQSSDKDEKSSQPQSTPESLLAPFQKPSDEPEETAPTVTNAWS